MDEEVVTLQVPTVNPAVSSPQTTEGKGEGEGEDTGTSVPETEFPADAEESPKTLVPKEGREEIRPSTPGDIATVVAEPSATATGYDTDLNEPEPPKLDRSQQMVETYRRACKYFGVIPSNYFIRHMFDSKLCMAHHGLGSTGIKPIAVVLANNIEIREADFSDNWLEARGGEYFGEVLKENYFITTLDLSNNQLGVGGAKGICRALAENGYLLALNLSGNHFTDDTIPYFDEVLRSRNACLQSLNLSHNEFGEKNAKMLGTCLSENITLEHLDLSWNLFQGKKTNRYVFMGLKNNVKLKVFEFSHNGIGLEGSKFLADMLRGNSVLTELDISDCRIPADAVLQVAKRGLACNESLRVLKISNNPLGAEGARTLVQKGLMNERSVLEVLDLMGVAIDREFLQMKTQICAAKDIQIIHGPPLSNYVIKGVYKKRVPFSHRPMELSGENVFEICAAFAEKHKLRLTLQVEKLIKSQPKEKDKKKKKMKLVPIDQFLDTLVEAGFIFTPEQAGAIVSSLQALKYEGNFFDVKPLLPLLKPQV